LWHVAAPPFQSARRSSQGWTARRAQLKRTSPLSHYLDFDLMALDAVLLNPRPDSVASGRLTM
jgi:hypothetical protein